MKKLPILLVAFLASIIANGQICLNQINSMVFTPVAGTTDLQLDIVSQCCEIHHFSGYTLTSNNSDHVISLCYQDTGLLMPSTITSTITLPGLNIGNQNFTINSSLYFGPPGASCSSGNTFNPPVVIALPATPLTQARTFLLATTDYNLQKASLFPNPNSGEFTLQLPADEQQAQVTITDLSGKKIVTIPTYLSGDSIQLKGLSKGLYFATIVCNQSSETLKFVVK